MANDNSTVARQFMDALAGADAEALVALLHPDFVAPAAFSAPGVSGSDSMRGALQVIHAAFSGFSVQIHDVIAEGDRVAVRDSISATHTGPIFSLDGTGKSFTVDELVWFTFRDGLVTQVWPIGDYISMLFQIGTLPL